ncbi:MAG: hypothetical protein ABFC28_02945 [Rikenellaceae bacterium]
MNKIYFRTVALLLTLTFALVSCTSREKAVTLKTKEFLDAYFSIDYMAASQYCTKELGEELVNSLKSLDSLEPTVRDMLVKSSKEVKTEIISVGLGKGKDTARVLYKVILPNFPDGIENTISLVKAGKSWCVMELGS